MCSKSLIQQGQGILRWLLLCVFFCAMSQGVMAQGGVHTDDDEESRFKAENPGFNAIDLHQKRFLYGDSIKYKERFHDIMRVGLTWHYNKIHRVSPAEGEPLSYEAVLNYGVFVERELGKLHALNLLLSGGTYQRESRMARLDMYQMELLYSFNWIRLFGGYNPYRKIEAVTNLGVGGFYSRYNNGASKEFGPLFTMGAGVRLLLNPLFVLGIDPYVSLASDNIDHSGINEDRKNLRTYDVLYGTNVSLSYTFRDELKEEERAKYFGKPFIDFGLGVQFQPSSGYLPASAATSPVPFFATAGPQLKLGVGHWFSNALALRATGNLSTSNWLNTQIEADRINGHPSYNARLRNVLMNARLDLLFSPYRFFTGREDNRFDINAVVGWEYGRMIKTAYNTDNLLRTGYDGFSGGLQLRYIYDKHTSLYIEPRITAANYVIPYVKPFHNYARRYRDYLFSLTAGMEFVTNEHSFKKRKEQPSVFAPHMLVSLLGGPNYLFTTRDHVGDSYLDFGGGVAVEMKMSPYSGVRLMADYSQISLRDIYSYTQIGSESYFGSNVQLGDTALCVGRYGYLNLSADYVFDMGTLLQGYNEANRWDVDLALGLVSSYRVNHKAIISEDEKLWEFRGDNAIASVPMVDHSRASKRAWGLQFGIPVSYRIAPSLDVLFEPRARFFPKSYIKQTHSQGVTKIINAQLGLRYALNNRYTSDGITNRFEELKEDESYRHGFMNLSVGTQYATGTGMPLGTTGGMQLGLGAGRWVNSLWGVRFGAEIGASHLLSVEEPVGNFNHYRLLKSARIGARADLMTNPLAFSRRYTPKHWGTALLFGWELGAKIDAMHTKSETKFYNSLAVGAQLRYHTDERHALYIEPRYTFNGHLMSLTAGLEFAMTEQRFHSSKKQIEEFNPYYSVGLAGGVNHLFLPTIYNGAREVALSTGVSGEFHFTPYSGTRATLDYSRTAIGAANGENIVNNGVAHLNVGVDYMFDLSTLLAGYTPYRRWDVALAAGPVFSARVTAPKEDVKSLKKVAMGLQVGIPVQCHINDHWGISLEPRARFMGLDYAAPEHITRGTMSKFLNLQMGLKYTF